MGIRFKLMAPLLIAAIVLFSLIHFHLKPQWLEHEHAEYTNMQKAMLETLSTNLTTNILSGDFAAMYETLDSELRSKSTIWKHLTVKTATGERIYPLEDVEKNSASTYIENITFPLSHDDTPLGHVTLHYDWSDAAFDINNHIFEIESILFLCFGSLLLIALVLQSAWLRIPMVTLHDAANAIIHGEEDVTLTPKGKDEIANLCRSFIKMRDNIKSKEAALQLAASEALIAERLLQDNQEKLLEEHHHAVTALEETQAVYRKLNQSHNEITHLRFALDQHAIVSTADINGDITYVNDKFCEISGYTTEELLGNNHRMLKSGLHVKEYYDDLWNHISNGKVWRGDICNHTKTGDEYWVEATIVPFLDDADVPYKYVAIRTDITDQVHAIERLRLKTQETNDAHAELKKSHQQALHSEKLASVGQLAAGIAHEINTPVQFIGDNTRFLQDAFHDMNSLIEAYHGLTNAISTSSTDRVHEDILTRINRLRDDTEVDYLSEEIPRAIDQTLEGVDRVSTIVLSMKDFSHPGSHQKELVNINQAIESTITVSRNEWKYHAELETDLDEKIKAVPCYVGELNQVILNIIINASHAIHDAKQGDELGVINIMTKQEEDFAEIRISDNGTGMPESIRNRIFEPFFTTKGVGKGSGQGLAIAYAVIVEKHGGELIVESVPGEGTIFIIRLPMRETDNPLVESNSDVEPELKLVQGGQT